MKARRIAVLIAAAGTGRRMGAGGNKLLMSLGDQPVLVHTLRLFQQHPAIQQIGIILRPEDRTAVEACLNTEASKQKLMPWIEGGAERFDSVHNGLKALAASPPEWVMVHDGARPFCSSELIDRILGALESAPGAIPVVPVTDTVRYIDATGSRVVDRSNLVRTQTPQGFHWDALWEAYSHWSGKGAPPTDDAQLLEERGLDVIAVPGDPANVKLTEPEDMILAQWRITQP